MTPTSNDPLLEALQALGPELAGKRCIAPTEQFNDVLTGAWGRDHTPFTTERKQSWTAQSPSVPDGQLTPDQPLVLLRFWNGLPWWRVLPGLPPGIGLNFPALPITERGFFIYQ